MNGSLRCKFKDIKSITFDHLEQMFRIHEKYYLNANIEKFTDDMGKKKGVFIVMEKTTDKIVGFSTWGEYSFMYEGKKAVGIFSGDTILEKEYWGDKSLQKAFAKKIILKSALNPHRRTFWFLITKGYKTYMLLANNFAEYYPNYRGENEGLKQVIDEYTNHLFPGAYNETTGLLHFGPQSDSLIGSVAPISQKEMRHPKIRFFAEKNPTWEQGTELPCIGEVSLKNCIFYVKKALGFGAANPVCQTIKHIDESTTEALRDTIKTLDSTRAEVIGAKKSLNTHSTPAHSIS